MKALAKFYAFAAMALMSGVVLADAVYPYTNPTYIPSAVSPSATYSAPADYAVTSNNVNTAIFNITGTCTSLAAVAQISVDGTNYVTVNVYPVSAGTVNGVSVAAASIAAAGMYRVNSSGAVKTRIHITALTASCSVAASGSTASFTTVE